MPICSSCQVDGATFSRGQLRKGAARMRCTKCVEAKVGAPPPPSVNRATDDAASGDLDASRRAPAPPKLLAHELAAQLVAKVERGGSGGVRTNLYDKSTKIPNKIRPMVTALVSEVVKTLPALNHAISEVAGPWAESSDAPTLALAKVLVHEMVVKGRSVKGGAKHPLAQAVWERRDALRATINASSAGAADAAASSQRKAAPLPRYVRVNTLKISVDGAKAALLADGDQPKLVATEPYATNLMKSI